MSRVKTQLTDLSGDAHTYECKPFAFDETFDLGLELAGVVGGPVGEAFKSMLLGAGLDDLDLDGQVIGGLATTMGDLPGRIATRGGSKLIARVLHNTTRVGIDSDDRKVLQLLREPDDRTAAYGGGNLREAIDAVAWVLTVHYGPFLMGLWGVLRKQLSGLESLQAMRQEPTESSEPKNDEQKPTEIAS